MLQVMVTDWNPLMVWFYDECYLRFSMANFSMENLEDNFTHLCNNSIQKEQDNFESVKDKSMWDLEAFRAHLAASHPNGDDLWTNKILPQMRHVGVDGRDRAPDVARDGRHDQGDGGRARI